jgi:cell division protein FtsA
LKKDPIAVLEIGTARTLVCVGEPDGSGGIRLTGCGSCPTVGVRKGQIIDFKNVSSCVETARVQAEEEADVNVWQIHMAVTGAHIQSQPHRERLPVASADKIVTGDDMEELNEMLRYPPLDTERVVLHTLHQLWSVDDQHGITEPEGMKCAMLARNTLVVSGVQNRVDNLKKVVHDLKMDVIDMVFDGVAAQRAVLSTAQKRDGVVLVDIGAGTTSVITYQNQIVVDAFCLGVGGDHITNDIACGFNIPVVKAEEIKCSHGSAVLDADRAYERIKIPGQETFGPETVSGKSLQIIINARMDEIFKIIRDRLDKRDLLVSLGAGVVLTGGGAALKGVDKLAQHVLGHPCQRGKIISVDGFADFPHPESYATAAGLLKYACDSLHLDKRKKGFLGTVAGKFFGR